MSEFLGEASVLIRPDTKAFRATLQSELSKATKGIVVNVPVIAAGGKTAKDVTAATTQQAAATKTLAAAQTTQTATAQKAFVVNAQLAKTAETLALAETQLAAASEAGALATTDLSARRAVLRATAAATTTAEKALAEALLAGNVAAVSAAQAQVQLAAAQEAVATTAVQEAISLRASSAAAVDSAAAHKQAARGAVATGASFLGLRGAVLASSGPFLAATIAVTGLFKAVKGASDDAEALAKVSQVLGAELGDNLADSARRLSFEIGVSDDEILKFQGTLANLLQQSSFTDQAIVGISEDMVKLGRDLAQFGQVDPSVAFKALQLGLTGNLRALRQFGIVLTTAEIKQRALNDTGKKSVSDLSRHEIALARLNLITRDAASISGAYEARQDGLSAQTNILKANIDDLSDSLGGLLIPIIGELAKTTNFAFVEMRRFAGSINEVKNTTADFIPFGHEASNVLKEVGTFAALGPVFGPLNLVRRALDDGTTAAQNFGNAFSQLIGIVQGAANALALFASEAGRANRAIIQAEGQAAGLEQKLNEAIIGGAGPGTIISIKQEQIARQQRKLRNAKRLKDTKDVRDATEAIAGLTEDIRGIEEGIASDQASASSAAASAASSAARDAQAALDAADAQVQAIIGRVQALHGLRSVFIDASVQVKDDLKEAVRFRKELLALLKGLVQTIHDEQLRTQIEIELKTAINEQTVAIREFEKAIEDNAKARKKAAEARKKRQRDEREEALELNIQIAQAQEDVKKELAARRSHLKNLQKRLGELKKGTNEWRRIKLEIEQEKRAIRDLLKETKDRGRLAASLQFEFLQQQQGFAANLLGNLIPQAAAAGTVSTGVTGLGITGKATGGLKIPPGGGGGFATPRTPFEHGRGQIQAGGAPRGTSQAQTATMIEILRGILRTLNRQKRNSAIPEAQYERAKGSASGEML